MELELDLLHLPTTNSAQQTNSSNATSANARSDETTISDDTNEAICPCVLSPVPLVRGRSAVRTRSNGIWPPTPVREAKRNDDMISTRTTVSEKEDVESSRHGYPVALFIVYIST